VIFRKQNIKQKEQLPTIIEKLKQQLQAKAQRVKRFEKRQKFFHQNKTFKKKAKKFYRELGKKNPLTSKRPLKSMK